MDLRAWDRRALLGAAGAAGLLPLAGLLAEGALRGAVLALACAALWAAALAWRPPRLAAPAFVATAALAAAAVLVGARPLPMLAGLVAALCAYDLSAFGARLGALEGAERNAVAAPHLRRLALTAGLGLAGGALALLPRWRPGFAGLAALALCAVGALALGVGWMLRQRQGGQTQGDD